MQKLLRSDIPYLCAEFACFGAVAVSPIIYSTLAQIPGMIAAQVFAAGLCFAGLVCLWQLLTRRVASTRTFSLMILVDMLVLVGILGCFGLISGGICGGLSLMLASLVSGMPLELILGITAGILGGLAMLLCDMLLLIRLSGFTWPKCILQLRRKAAYHMRIETLAVGAYAAISTVALLLPSVLLGELLRAGLFAVSQVLLLEVAVRTVLHMPSGESVTTGLNSEA